MPVVTAIWPVFKLDHAIPLMRHGLEPRMSSGMNGIASMPCRHSGLNHLARNPIPLLGLLMLLAASRERSWLIVLTIILPRGGRSRVFGRVSPYNVSSALISGLAAGPQVSGACAPGDLGLLWACCRAQRCYGEFYRQSMGYCRMPMGAARSREY
jgi:hypothetical protein